MGRTVVIKSIATHLPAGRLDNEELSRRFPEWSPEDILRKTGIRARALADPQECASDLAHRAAEKLLAGSEVRRADIDVLAFCTQSPDYLLPTTACVLQDRLALPQRCMAFDFNLGCSGYVYGLALVQGLLASGIGRRALLLTADTYTHYVHPSDRATAAIFGDAGTATLLEAVEDGSGGLGPFVFGTDGSGHANLMVPASACRPASNGKEGSQGPRPGRLHMDGPRIFEFCMRRVPAAVRELLALADTDVDGIDRFVFHQANRFMMESIRKRLGISADRFAYRLEDVGNTVSSTIPMALEAEIEAGRIREGNRVMLVGFGVGYSWGACLVDWPRG